MKDFVTESAVHGVVLVAGLVVIVASTADASWDILVKVAATVGVFWAAHVYAVGVAHLGDEYDGAPARVRVASAARYSLDHSWGMLGAAAVPIAVLLLGVLNVLSDSDAIWGTLWVSVALLGVLGYAAVSSWTPRVSLRLASAAVTLMLGLVLIGLKAYVS